MPIPQSQLEVWSHQGAKSQSASTYGTVRLALEASDTKYAGKHFNVFLQGSYGNDTNIYSESDVDVVICYKGAFFKDISGLTPEENQAYTRTFSQGQYKYNDFKEDVIHALRQRFGAAVKPGKKAIKIEAEGNRRSADVIIAFEYRRYHAFRSLADQDYSEGICFYQSDNIEVVNYPKQHSKNLTVKHQVTGNNLKPMVRILKNIRSRLVDRGLLGDGVAPSYYLEGLLYNVPSGGFSSDYSGSIESIYNWLANTDRTSFLCANEQYYLLRESNVTWSPSHCEQFLQALKALWRNWYD